MNTATFWCGALAGACAIACHAPMPALKPHPSRRRGRRRSRGDRRPGDPLGTAHPERADTGRHNLDDNPFRDRSRPYVERGQLGEIVLGPVRLFDNAENLLDVRLTRYDPLIRPMRAPDGRWTVDAWAPTDGFIANAGVRLQFGGG